MSTKYIFFSKIRPERSMIIVLTLILEDQPCNQPVLHGVVFVHDHVYTRKHFNQSTI